MGWAGHLRYTAMLKQPDIRIFRMLSKPLLDDLKHSKSGFLLARWGFECRASVYFSLK